MLCVSFQPRDAVFTLVVNLPFLVKKRSVNGGEKCAAETTRSLEVITGTVTSLFRLAKLCLNDVRVNNTPYKQTVPSVWPRNHRDADSSR